jgi:histidyl-tRNA synthetase
MKKPKFQTPTGMDDILPEDQRYFQKIYDVVEEIAKFYNFQKIDTPILEETELFSRGIGLATDIVQKEMYSFRTKGGDWLSLRPEGTAPVVRAYLQHGMESWPQPVKLWYFGPFFRHERPQLGRYRQFWQFGFEVLGEAASVIDVQIIQIFFNIFKELKLKNLIVEINSIGDSACRPYYKKVLTAYFRSKIESLCQNCKRRLKENPLRILDCKEEKCQIIVSQAPQMVDHLCELCHRHFKEVLETLDELGLPYHLNTHLVRGLDYYTKTVFEFFPELPEDRKMGALAGGGRYDNLAKILANKEIPAVGGAGGIERIVAETKKREIKFKKEREPKIFLAQLGFLAKRKSLKLIEEFRKAKIPIAESLGRDSLKAQLRMADRIGARYTLILGQKEALGDEIIIRDMVSGRQEAIKLEKLLREIKKILKMENK